MQSNLPAKFIEKQEVVIKILDKLFSEINGLVFKGGTSLALVYDLTKRFSEDIDLSIVDELANDIKVVEEINAAIIKCVTDLGYNYELLDKDDEIIKELNQMVTIRVFYKSVAEASKYDETIIPGVVLIEPQVRKRKKVTTLYEHKSKNSVIWRVQSIESTFSEKISLLAEETILSENFVKWVTADKRSNPRHFYDLYMLSTQDVKPNKKTFDARFFRDVWSTSKNSLREKYVSFELLAKSHKDYKKFKSELDSYIADLKKLAKQHEQYIDEAIKLLVYPKTPEVTINKIINNYIKFMEWYLVEAWKLTISENHK